MAVNQARLWIAAGALAGFGGVVISAIAVHALPQRLEPSALHQVQVAIQMQVWHALALLATGLLAARGGRTRLLNLAGTAFLAGILLFCGAVYSGALAGVHLGPLAPAGGLILMLGWLLLAAATLTGEAAL